MNDIARILALWRELGILGADYVLATVVAVEGPSYRKPGALMLLTPDGRRAGTVSGGCLEAQVASRAWWLTANGPTIQRYSTADEDGERPFGSGCGGVIYMLLERRATADPLLAAVDEAFRRRVSMAAATVLEGPHIGQRACAFHERGTPESPAQALEAAQVLEDRLQQLADRAAASRESIESEVEIDGVNARAWSNYRAARPGLWIFGAGDDAQSLLRMAKELGWFVAVADGRSHLATRERFPLADELHVLPMQDPSLVPGLETPLALGHLHPEDAAVVMTHSFEQDSKILACLLSLDAQPGYIGVLGPQGRTHELLAEAAILRNLPPSVIQAQAERWFAQLHAPTGLDLGGGEPESIALSILAEIQKVRTASTALPLRTVRAAAETIAR